MTHFVDLQELADDESRSLDDRRIAEALASAINDWPTYDLTSLEDYVAELRREVAAPLTRENVRSRCNSYSLSTDAWKCESLCSLLNAWEKNDVDVMLDDLIKRIAPDF